MSNENKIRILYVQPDKYPEERLVANELHPFSGLSAGIHTAENCKARHWTQDESATVNFGFYRKSASVCQPHTSPSPLKQKIPP